MGQERCHPLLNKRHKCSVDIVVAIGPHHNTLLPALARRHQRAFDIGLRIGICWVDKETHHCR